MLLVIDLGNTTLTIGLFKDSILTAHWRLSTEHTRMPDEYGIQISNLLQSREIIPSGLKGICFSSVVPPLTNNIVEACQLYLNQSPFITNADVKLNYSIAYDDPYAVGADRLADAAAVIAKYSIPACVIDFGTATTFNAISKSNEYLGGAILPGIQIAADALVQRTAKLPPVTIEVPPSPIGRNTVHSIQAGLTYGFSALVNGMVKLYKNELGADTIIIATGGYVDILSKQIDVIDFIDPWLTLEGLRVIWELNH